MTSLATPPLFAVLAGARRAPVPAAASTCTPDCRSPSPCARPARTCTSPTGPSPRSNRSTPTHGWLPRTRVRPPRAAYRAPAKRLDSDALVLVDGGTDNLMRGDEAGLGTPVEDMTSLAAAARLRVPAKLVVSLGFGIDAYHGVNQGLVLENLAALAGEVGDDTGGARQVLGRIEEFRDGVDRRIPHAYPH